MTNTRTFTGLSSGGWFKSSTTSQDKKETDPILQRLHKIRDSYDKNTKSFRFQAIVYDTKANTSMGSWSSCPACVQEADWEQAKAAAPNSELTPRVLEGFDQLRERASAQEEIADQMEEKLEDMKCRIEELKEDFANSVAVQMKKIAANNDMINRLMMNQLESEEMEELKSMPFTNDEADLVDKLSKLEKDIDKPRGFTAQLNMLKSRVRYMKETTASEPEVVLTDGVRERAMQVLGMHTKALKALSQVVKRMRTQTDATYEQLKKLIG